MEAFLVLVVDTGFFLFSKKVRLLLDVVAPGDVVRHSF